MADFRPQPLLGGKVIEIAQYACMPHTTMKACLNKILDIKRSCAYFEVHLKIYLIFGKNWGKNGKDKLYKNLKIYEKDTKYERS